MEKDSTNTIENVYVQVKFTVYTGTDLAGFANIGNGYFSNVVVICHMWEKCCTFVLEIETTPDCCHWTNHNRLVFYLMFRVWFQSGRVFDDYENALKTQKNITFLVKSLYNSKKSCIFAVGLKKRLHCKEKIREKQKWKTKLKTLW